MPASQHHHPCVSCARKLPCNGTWRRNVDGHPEVVCEHYHLPYGIWNPDWLCDQCRKRQQADESAA